MTNYDVVKKLIGRIDSVGESHTDSKRFENLKETCQLVDELITDIANEASNSRAFEHSRKKSGEYAEKFLNRIGESLRKKL